MMNNETMMMNVEQKRRLAEQSSSIISENNDIATKLYSRNDNFENLSSLECGSHSRTSIISVLGALWAV
jgi:hypothetical protein